MKKHPYIAVTGTMGVGKSTAAALLATRLGYTLVSENFGDNLFLARFYKDMKRWAFHSQTFFLMEKISQMMNTKKLLTTSSVIQDTPIEQDAYSYARAHVEMGNIDEAEWELYEKILKTFAPVLPKPTLIVSLEAPMSVIAKRIEDRGRGFEKSVPLSYLKRLQHLNSVWIDVIDRHTKVIHIDTSHLDIVSNERDQASFVARVTEALSK